MIFTPTGIAGAFIVQTQPHRDERGSFLRLFDQAIFEQHGLTGAFTQHSAACNVRKGTLRGLHYQLPPRAEAKLVRCTRGAIFDVGVDLRRQSPTFRQVVSVELGSQTDRMLYLPAGCAHGYQTLDDETEVTYLISASYDAALSRGVHFADPDLAIQWPLPVSSISERDRSFPPLARAELPPV